YRMSSVGYFVLAQRVVGLPTRFVGPAVAQAYFGRASEIARNEPSRLRGVYVQVLAALLVAGSFPVSAIVLSSAHWVPFVFGAEWADISGIFWITAPAVVAQFGIGSLAQTLLIANRPGRQAAWELFRAVVVSSALSLAGVLNLEFNRALQ